MILGVELENDSTLAQNNMINLEIDLTLTQMEIT